MADNEKFRFITAKELEEEMEIVERAVRIGKDNYVFQKVPPEEMNAFLRTPSHIYVKGWPLSMCGWNGPYRRFYHPDLKRYQWELISDKLFGFLPLRKTIIRREKERWVMLAWNGNQTVLVNTAKESALLNGKRSGPGNNTPFGAWNRGMYVDEQYFHPHEYRQLLGMLVIGFSILCLACFFIVIHLFKNNIIAYV